MFRSTREKRSLVFLLQVQITQLIRKITGTRFTIKKMWDTRYGSTPRKTGMARRSEEHTSELQSLMRISYAVFCLKKKKYTQHTITQPIANDTTIPYNTHN